MPPTDEGHALSVGFATLESLLEGTPAGLAVLDGQLSIVHTNAVFRQMTGQLVGREAGNVVANVMPGLHQTVLEACRTVFDTGVAGRDLTAVIAPGAQAVTCRIVPVGNAGKQVQGVAVVVRHNGHTEYDGALLRAPDHELLAVEKALAPALDTTEVKRTILQKVVPLMGAYGGTLIEVVDDQTLFLVGAVGYGPSAELSWTYFPAQEHYPVVQALRTRRPVFATVEELGRDFPEFVPMLQPETRAVAALPLEEGDHVTCALTLSFDDEQAITPERQSFLLEVLEACACALKRARRYNAAHEERKRAVLLAEVSAALAASLDLQGTLDRLASLALRHVADWATVFLAGDDGLPLPVAVAHHDPGMVELLRWFTAQYPSDPSTPGSTAWVMRTGTPLLMPVVPGALIDQIEDQQRRLAVQRMGLHSLIQVPLIANDRTVGVLALATTHPQRTYGPDDLVLAQELAERAALALDNAARYEASQISEHRYRSLIDATRQIVWTNTADGMLLGRQPGWTQLTGQTEAEYTGLGWTDRVNPEDLNRTFDAWQEALTSRTVYESRQRVTVASGEERHFNVRAVPVLDLDGQVREWVGVHTDITEHVRAETRLRNSEERFRSLVEASPIGIAVGAMDGSMHLANDAYLHMLGHTRAEFDAGQVNWAALTPPEFRELDIRAFEQAFAEGTSEAYEKEMVCRDGRRIPVGLVLTRYEKHDQSFVVAYVQDLAVQKEAERALREYGGELERRVEERTRALAQTNAELERFAYVASHDLQEPLRTIAGLTGLLERRYANLYDERGQNLLRLIVEGTARMKTLLDDLLVFSRLGAELLTLEPVSATHVVEEARGRLSGLLEESGGEVTWGPLPMVQGNVFQLIQVFQNLIANALKFQKPGAVPHVRISARPDGEFCHFTVEDNGIGIDPAYFDRIFVMFQRLHGRDQYAGTGLGLAICQKVVERHGGRMWVDSTPGEGSAFHFTLKAVQAGPEA